MANVKDSTIKPSGNTFGMFAPQKRESNEYVPTAGGFDTGESFAIISVFHNPGYGGQVLLIAGASGEGTKAARDVVGSTSPGTR